MTLRFRRLLQFSRGIHMAVSAELQIGCLCSGETGK
jgi:hypothetical protein